MDKFLRVIEILNNNAAKKFRIPINSFKKSKILIPNETLWNRNYSITSNLRISSIWKIENTLKKLWQKRFLIEKMFDSRAFQLEYYNLR